MQSSFLPGHFRVTLLRVDHVAASGMAQRKGKTPARKNINGIPLENDTTKSLEKYFQGNEGPTIQKTETNDLTPPHFNKQNKKMASLTLSS